MRSNSVVGYHNVHMYLLDLDYSELPLASLDANLTRQHNVDEGRLRAAVLDSDSQLPGLQGVISPALTCEPMPDHSVSLTALTYHFLPQYF